MKYCHQWCYELMFLITLQVFDSSLLKVFLFRLFDIHFLCSFHRFRSGHSEVLRNILATFRLFNFWLSAFPRLCFSQNCVFLGLPLVYVFFYFSIEYFTSVVSSSTFSIWCCRYCLFFSLMLVSLLRSLSWISRVFHLTIAR